jgi:hypothetical protein
VNEKAPEVEKEMKMEEEVRKNFTQKEDRT